MLRLIRRRDALKKMGAPEDLVIGIEEPTVQKTNDLMAQCDRVLATGGGAMVNAAYVRQSVSQSSVPTRVHNLTRSCIRRPHANTHVRNSVHCGWINRCVVVRLMVC